MENNHLNMVMNRQSSRSHPSMILSDWNNNSSNIGSNSNNVSNTLCNWCESSDHKGINCSHKNKICDYCKRKGHLQKACYKKKCNDRVNSITTDKKDDPNHALINVFITLKKSHKNQLTRHDSGRICSLQESHYTFMIIIDSETTCHIFYNRTMFELIELTMQNASVINENPLSIQKWGNVHLHCKINERINKITFQNTLYISDLKYYVISFKRMNKSNFMIIFQKGVSQLQKNDRTWAEIDIVDNLYMLRTQWSEFLKKIISAITFRKASGFMKALPMATWYGHFAHMNYCLIGELESMGVFVNNLSTPPCNTCAQGKAKQHVSRQAHRAAAALKLIHTNVSELIPTTFFSKQYYVIFKDDYTNLKKPYFMKTKDETAKCFEEYKNLVKNQLKTKIKCLWSDEEGEYAETEFMSILKRAGIQWELSAPYTPAQNRITEHIHYLIFNSVRSIMIAIKLSKSL